MRYRPEIDGLRAVAVIPVILYHANVTAFSGGFIGVDVFFAISGYLITQLIVIALDEGTFSIVGFYERRARRILPALFFVMLCCIPIAWALMLPDQFKAFSKSIVAVSLFSSNILFFGTNDYFAAPSELMPLLHTWSLAVEEQYYILFPPLMLLLWRRGRRHALWALVSICVLSFLICEWGWRTHPGANFYLAPSRTWELMLGAIAALWERKHGARTSNLLASAGFAAIVIAVFTYDTSTPFPSVYALLPVGGAVAVLMFGRDGTLPHRFLSSSSFVGIGLISYSAYLWHQPLFALARIRYTAPPPLPVMLGLAALALGLAYFSWRFVERPFRGPAAVLKNRKQLFLTASVPVVLYCMIGALGVSFDGNLWRYDRKLIDELATMTRQDFMPQRCSTTDFVQMDTKPCVVGKGDARVRLVVLGDSHAMQLGRMLDSFGRKYGVRIEMYTRSACSVASIVYYYPGIRRVYSECPEWRDRVVTRIAADDPRHILLTNSDIGYIDSVPIDYYVEGLAKTIERLSSTGAGIVYLLDNPEFRAFDPIRCYAAQFLRNGSYNAGCELPREAALGSALRSNERDLAKRFGNLQVLDASAPFCDEKSCFVADASGIFMHDRGHLSNYGVSRLEPVLASALAKWLAVDGVPEGSEKNLPDERSTSEAINSAPDQRRQP